MLPEVAKELTLNQAKIAKDLLSPPKHAAVQERQYEVSIVVRRPPKAQNQENYGLPWSIFHEQRTQCHHLLCALLAD